MSELSDKQQSKTSYTENILVSCRRGAERHSLSSIFERLGFKVFQSDYLCHHACRKCAAKERNLDLSIPFVQELNQEQIKFDTKVMQISHFGVEHDIRISYFTTFINAFRNMSNISLFLSFEDND